MFEIHGMTIANHVGVTHQQIEAVRSLLDTGGDHSIHCTPSQRENGVT